MFFSILGQFKPYVLLYRESRYAFHVQVARTISFELVQQTSEILSFEILSFGDFEILSFGRMNMLFILPKEVLSGAVL